MADAILILLLVAATPAYALWRSLKRGDAPKPTRIRRYLRAMALPGALLAALAAIWVSAGRPAALLGLALPLSQAGLIGLAVAALVLAAMVLATFATPQKPRRAAKGAAEGADLMPATAAEFAVFVVFAIVLGVAWEALYRGYLLWALTAHVGAAGAVIIAALAYGLAHGFKHWRGLAGSVVAAFVFTIGYVLTHSLWWLIVLHIGLPLVGALAFRTMRGNAAV
jgi:membrane protease YdiL (CAAX protease family)